MKRFWTIAFGFALLAQPAAADQCGLLSFGSFDVGAAEDGIVLHGTVEGQAIDFYASLGSPYTGISESFAAKLRTSVIEAGDVYGVHMGSTDVTHVVKVPLQIGALHANSFRVLIIPKEAGGDKDYGILGMDVLNRVDIELDLAHGKVNLFSREHCPGKVVYWANAYAAVPMTIDGTGMNWFKMQLDGKDVRAVIAASYPETTFPMTLAKSIFGLDAKSPRMVEMLSSGEFPTYQYPFSTLSSSSLTINNPAIVIVDDRASRCHRYGYAFYWEQNCNDTNFSFLWLGRNVLKQLRIYLAFGEKRAYFTGADAH